MGCVPSGRTISLDGVVVCDRCGKNDHTSYECYASRDVNGSQIRWYCDLCNTYHSHKNECRVIRCVIS